MRNDDDIALFQEEAAELIEALEQLVGSHGVRVVYGPPTGTASSAYG